LSPEITSCGRLCRGMSGGRAGALQWPGAFVRAAGVKEQGIDTRGFPRNLGRSVDLLCMSRPGLPGDQPQAQRRFTRRRGERKSSAPEVPPSEGNEARRDGRRKSHTFVVPWKQGNLDRRDPGEGRGVPRQGTVEGKLDRGFVPGSRVTGTSTGSTAAGESLTGRTGCLNRARPDLWGPLGG
jgi:hypothetical protein